MPNARFKQSALCLALSISASNGFAVTLQKTPPADTPVIRGKTAFRLADRELIPEGIAYDPEGRSFYVGSMHKRKIVQVHSDGVQVDFAAQGAEGLWSVLGMKVDAERRELLANSCNLMDRRPPMIPDEQATRGKAGLFRYDLKTRKLIARYVLGWEMAPRCFNDLVIAPDGTVYLSTGPDGIYRVRRGETRAELLREYHGFVNGIAASDDGRQLFLADHVSGVQVMDVASGTVQALVVPTDERLVGIDGLYVRGRTLIGIQNGRKGHPGRVLQAELSPSLTEATCVGVVENRHPDYDIPTTGALVGNELFYIASSQMHRFNDDKTIFPKEKLTESLVLRTPLLQGCAEPS